MPPVLGNLIVIAVLVLAVGLAIRSVVKNHKKGGCGCGCDSCPNSGMCHPEK